MTKHRFVLALIQLSLWIGMFRTWAKEHVLGEPTWNMAPPRGLFRFQIWLLETASKLRKAQS